MNIEANSQIRAFIAVSLPDAILGFLKGLQSEVRSKGFKASWPRVENMHLTLKFLGNIDVQKIPDIETAMSRAAGLSAKASLTASGIGVFPSVKRARVIWSGTRGQTDILAANFKVLEDHLVKEAGIQKEKKRFHPHFTLARIKKPVQGKQIVKLMQAYQNRESPEFFMSSIKLFQSELKSSGAVYTKLFEAKFLN